MEYQLKIYNRFTKTMYLVMILNCMILSSCQPKPDFDKLRSEILAKHKMMIEAHWQKDADHIVSDMADNFMFVQGGDITRPGKDEVKERMEAYLNTTTFSEYRDLQEPVIGFSKDGSTAWSIVQVKIAGRRKNQDGSERDMDFTCAWITLYEKQWKEWIRLAEVSNFK